MEAQEDLLLEDVRPRRMEPTMSDRPHHCFKGCDACDEPPMSEAKDREKCEICGHAL